MQLKPPRVGEILAGAFGVLLLVSLFLPWYRDEAPACLREPCPAAPTRSAWEAFAVLDLVLLAVALAGVGLLVVEVTQRTPAIPVAWSAIAALLALVAVGLVLWRSLSPPGGSGVEPVFSLLGLAASAGLAGGCFASMRDEGVRLRGVGPGTRDRWPEPLSVPAPPTDAEERP
jgi:hypothetical protein